MCLWSKYHVYFPSLASLSLMLLSTLLKKQKTNNKKKRISHLFWIYKLHCIKIQFSSVQSLSRVWLFVTPRTAARQASLSITNSQSSLKLMSMESVMPSNHLILCRPLLLPPSIPPSIRVFSNESVLHIRCPKYCIKYINYCIKIMRCQTTVQNFGVWKPPLIKTLFGSLLYFLKNDFKKEVLKYNTYI